jgi:desulfoferrodoxin-like iron-binding protein
LPVFDYRCEFCGKVKEVLIPQGDDHCCGQPMTRLFTGHTVVKMGSPMWIDRLEDIGKKQNDRGERRKFVHPSQLGGNLNP